MTRTAPSSRQWTAPSSLEPDGAVGSSWLAAGVFEVIVSYRGVLLRWLLGLADQPPAAISDSTTRHSTSESGHRAADDGFRQRHGSKLHAAAATLGELLTLRVTPANVQDRAHGARPVADVQDLTGEHNTLAFVDQGSTGETAVQAAGRGIQVEVVKLVDAERGVVLLPRRWVMTRSFAWATRFRRVTQDNERLPETVEGLYVLAVACLMLRQVFILAAQRP